MTGFDQVLSVRAGVRAEAIRNIPSTLDIFATHFPRFPVLPGVLILDELAAVARLALGDPGDGCWLLAEAHRVRYRRYVEPGDQLVLAAQVVEARACDAVCQGVARVDGRTVATVRELRMTRIATREEV
ncbi:3-hydroxyacyl-ACP dehydratase FabZ family protein [Amycolatopsis anabasis]|uniref:3-hydroxyacyl-ACP dehydratase FabZ family protein n=1 Tax=Amycolatopsis anabasis TaxID=1840409 RepID=UPI00131EB253|nr:hydroxymyristoyl-ACP dehydratase [Amycolatopsis anabasis]